MDLCLPLRVMCSLHWYDTSQLGAVVLLIQSQVRAFWVHIGLNFITWRSELVSRMSHHNADCNKGVPVMERTPVDSLNWTLLHHLLISITCQKSHIHLAKVCGRCYLKKDRVLHGQTRTEAWCARAKWQLHLQVKFVGFTMKLCEM